MKQVKLTKQGIEATISLDGAYVTALQDNGVPILYEKRTITMADGQQKIRGGMHLCIPQFGPGGSSGLPQHGFGRNSRWQLVDSAAAYVTLRLDSRDIPEEYAGLEAEVTYQLDDELLFVATLSIANASDRPLRISPGFHPYFYTRSSAVKVDDHVHYVDQLDPVLFRRGISKLELDEHTLSFTAPRLAVWALWTDNEGDYVCLEPTLAGFSFDKYAESLPDEELPAHTSRTYNFSFRWR